MVCGPIDHLAPLEAIGFPRGNCLYRVYSEGHHNSKQVYFKAIQGLLQYKPHQPFFSKSCEPKHGFGWKSLHITCLCMQHLPSQRWPRPLQVCHRLPPRPRHICIRNRFTQGFLFQLVVEKLPEQIGWMVLNRWNSWCWCLERKAKGQIHLLNQHHGNSSYFSLVDIGLIMFPHVKPTHAIPCHLTRIGWRSIASFFHCWFHNVIWAIYWE